MKLIFHNPDNCTPDFGTKANKCTISFNSRSGVIGISKSIRQITEIGDTGKFLFAQDEKRPQDWYITNHETGFPVRFYAQKQTCSVINKALVNKLLKSLNLADMAFAMFRVSHEAVEVNGQKYFPIITRQPLKVR